MLTERIAAEIAVTGPMPYDRFMEVALYDPEEGFFGSGTLRSHRGGDFLTSPEVSPLFGAALGRFVAAEQARLGAPVAVIDCGAGSGSLLAALLEAVPVARAVAVEVSPAARRTLRDRLPGVAVVGSLDEVPAPLAGVIVANELLDNLPAAVALRVIHGWGEAAITVAGDRLVEVLIEARSEVAAWADAHAPDMPPGSRVEVQLAAASWLRTALGLLHRGAVVVIDYGDTAEGLAPRRAAGTMRTYRAHHLGPDPLAEPGATDITIDVDFGALLAVAVGCGAEADLHTQRGFLEEWGLRERLTALRREEWEAARDGRTMERMRLRSRVTEAETLLHPRGLGDFRVLVARK